MDSVRLRRLKADHDALRRLARLHPKIEIEGVVGNPPERYRLKLKVKSLREKGEVVEMAAEHRLEVTMPHGYPRDAPLFRMLTPVFHPNIAPHTVCIGDHWTAGESIDHLIQRVGEILAYQSYNTQSPLNGRAAQWVDEHRDRLPIDAEEFFVDLTSSAASSHSMAQAKCENCGAKNVTLTACDADHIVCGDCAVPCPTCGKLQCTVCGTYPCKRCTPSTATTVGCENCGAKSVSLLACDADHILCGDCAVACGKCGRVQCTVCGTYPCRACA
jgi:ubiquitin-protein ligase